MIELLKLFRPNVKSLRFASLSLRIFKKGLEIKQAAKLNFKHI